MKNEKLPPPSKTFPSDIPTLDDDNRFPWHRAAQIAFAEQSAVQLPGILDPDPLPLVTVHQLSRVDAVSHPAEESAALRPRAVSYWVTSSSLCQTCCPSRG